MQSTMKADIRAGRTVLGMFLSEIAHPNLIRLMKAAGAQFVVVDCEHGYFDYSQVAAIAAVASGIGFPMIVRMPSLQREHVQKYLDAGAEGVWVPMLETREQAEELVRLSKYAPLGQRGISTMRPHSDYAPGKLTEYMEKANGHTMAFAQIETRRAVENAEEIAAVEGLDGLFIGPNDLACDLGCTGRFDTPEMDAAVSHVLAAAKTHGKPCGIVASNPAYLRRWAEQGMTMFSCDSELGLLKKGIQGMVSSVGLT